MAQSNSQRVGRMLELVVDGLVPLIERVLNPQISPGTSWSDLVRAVDAKKSGSANGRYSADDPQIVLRVLTERLPDPIGWGFNGHLGRAEQNMASELRQVRNDWAHSTSFSHDDAYRALDTGERLLRAAGAVAKADEVRVLRQDLQRGTYETRARKQASKPVALATGDKELPAWWEVLEPHPDVAAGRYSNSQFAADLYQVAVDDKGAPADREYSDPVEFFRRTYLTAGLRDLLSRSVARVAGTNAGDPVINLQTTFGGGKTHSMLAVWHLFSGTDLTVFPQDVQDVVADSKAELRTDVRRVAIVGNEIPPGQPITKSDGTQVHTLWGELAWQLGGPEAYAYVAEADRTGTNPGNILRDLFRDFGPAVVLIDEWVAYARQLHGADRLCGGSFDTQFTFAQALTQAVAAVPGCLLLISVPASDARNSSDEVIGSDLEVGGEHGQTALVRLDNVVRRVAHQWAPASKDESYEIVRRRLFIEPDGQALDAIAVVARRIVNYYVENKSEVPREATQPAYLERIRAAYPIHPELLDRLYNDWSALDRFQRTRGVLRLMSSVVQALYERQDPSPLIMPGAVPLDEGGARSEVVQYLDARWNSIIQADIDSETSVSRAIDEDRLLLGKRSLTLRTARAVFLAATPTLAAVDKGVDRKRIALGVVLPGDALGNLNSALGALAEQSVHFFAQGDRYWYDTQPSVNRMVQDQARNLDEKVVHDEVVSRLRDLVRVKTEQFTDVVVAPESSADVPDTDQARLVILHPRFRVDSRSTASTAVEEMRSLLKHKGTGQRVHVNMLLGLAADSNGWGNLEGTVRQHLAWKEIHQRKKELDLTQQNAELAERKVTETSRTVDDQILATWIWALYAEQPEPLDPMEVGRVKAEGSDKRLLHRVGAKLVKDDQLRIETDPRSLRLDLDHGLRNVWNKGHVPLGHLWAYLARYPYLARLRDKSVLVRAVDQVQYDAGWAQQGFALAEGYDETTGLYQGLYIPFDDKTAPDLVDTVLLVRPDLAILQRAEENAQAAEQSPDGDNTTATGPGIGVPGTSTAAGGRGHDDGAGGRSDGTAAASTPQKTLNVRYKARLELDPQRDLRGQVTMFVDEILQNLRFASPDVLEVSIDVFAEKSAGFPEHTVRAVKENSTVLGLDQSEFRDF